MAQNFFSTVWSKAGGDPLDLQNDQDGGDNIDAMQDPMGLGVFQGGPTFVKSEKQTLLTEEHDIQQSRQKKAKVTFLKPKKPQPAPEKKPAAPASDENFARKGARTAAQKQDYAKVQKLEESVNELYGSKAYAMLQKMSQQKNKRDAAMGQEDSGSDADENEEVKDSDKKKFTLGEGIGKHGQGILNPVQADLMPAQGGVGTTPKVTA